jgi:TonB family protein
MNLLQIAFAALTASGAGAPEASAGSWKVERIDSQCTLFRQETGARPTFLALQTLPGSGLIRLIVADPAWSDTAAVEAASSSVLLDNGGAVTGEKARPVHTPAGAGVEMTGIDQSVLATIAAAGSIRLEGKGKTRFLMKLPHAAAAVGEFRDCEAGSLREWGVDTVARAGLRRLPKPAGAGIIEWFRWQDYPHEAVRARISGTVVARIAVSVSGAATDCAVAVTSGHRALDERTCKSILKRARFEPALDSAGKAVRSDYVIRAVWRTP